MLLLLLPFFVVFRSILVLLMLLRYNSSWLLIEGMTKKQE